jgi:hypothetical protein
LSDNKGQNLLKDSIMTHQEEMLAPLTLAIKPACNYNNGSSIAIFDEATDKIIAHEQLFAMNHTELAQKVRKFWQLRVGGEKEPNTLSIEYPQTISCRFMLIFDMLCTLIEAQFSPMTTIRKRASTSLL